MSWSPPPTPGQRHYYLVAESSDRDVDLQRAYAYPLPRSKSIDAVLSNLGMDDEAQAVRVPEAWVRLFPPGGALPEGESFQIDRYGRPSQARGLEDRTNGCTGSTATRPRWSPTTGSPPSARSRWRSTATRSSAAAGRPRR